MVKTLTLFLDMVNARAGSATTSLLAADFPRKQIKHILSPPAPPAFFPVSHTTAPQHQEIQPTAGVVTTENTHR